MRTTGNALRRFDRKSILLGSAALMVGMALSSAAQAQCANTLGAISLGGRAILPAAAFTPFAQGSSINSLVSVLNTSTSVFQAQTGSAFVSSPANVAPDTNGGGVWGRAIGGRIDTDNRSVTTVAGVGGSITCDTTTRNSFAGYQVGRDIAELNWNGWNVHMGATAGYLESNSRDVTNGSFTSNTQAPFFGSYAAVTKGGFFADAQVRWDYYNMRPNDPVAGLYDQNFNARGWTVAGGLGYNIALPNNWFVEPSAGFTYSKTEVDPLNVAGTLIQLTSPGLVPPATVQINDIKSELGRLSVRFGTNVTTQYAAVQPFITASVYREFAGDVTTNIRTNFGAGCSLVNVSIGGVPICSGGASTVQDLSSTVSTSRVGTYGQISGGFAAQLLNTGWLGYARGDYRFGENIDGWTLNAGLRYQFMPDPVAAAITGKHPIYKAAPVAIVAPVNWSGFYIGANAGTIWGKTDYTFVSNGAEVQPKYAGALAGGQVGYNYQIGKWVLGLEGDFDWSNGKGAAACPNGFYFTCETNIGWFATATARVGYAWERTLFFVKGGFAAADVKQQTYYNPSVFSGLSLPVGGVLAGSSSTATGWTIGAGAEYALNASWSAKAEWLYYDLGTERYTVGGNSLVDARERGGVARVGVNYRFSTWGMPVVAKY